MFMENISVTAKQVRERVSSIIFGQPQIRQIDQLVPILPTDEPKKSNSAVNRVSSFVLVYTWITATDQFE